MNWKWDFTVSRADLRAVRDTRGWGEPAGQFAGRLLLATSTNREVFELCTRMDGVVQALLSVLLTESRSREFSVKRCTHDHPTVV